MLIETFSYGKRIERLGLGFQGIAARLRISPLCKLSLCAIEECLSRAKFFSGGLLRTSLFRRRDCLPRVTHLLHRRGRPAAGSHEQQRDQQTASDCTGI